MITYEEILKTDLLELNSKLEEICILPVPESLNSVEDLQDAQLLISTFTNLYSYLGVLNSAMKATVRVARDNKKTLEEKNRYSELVGKRDMIYDYYCIVEKEMKGLSRMITTKNMINEELRMLGHN